MDMLVCVDGSERSKKVVDYSVDLAKKISAKMVLLYVAQDKGVPEDFAEYASIEKLDLASYYEAVGEAVLSKLVERIADKGVTYETVIDFGHSAARIVDIARARKVDIIVVGLQGLHGLNRVRSLGSVSRRVLENAPCPVLVVHSEV